MRVLVVEDDDEIAEPMVRGLVKAGYEVERVATGADALATAADPAGADLVLLDLGLPDIDGFEVCRRLRERSRIPILVVTARDEEADRVIGLELGADDYIVKPFGLRELVARMRAVWRRTAAPVDETTRQVLGSLEIDRRARRVYVDNKEVALAPKEYDLLALLAEEPGALVRRQDILEEVWDPHWYGPTKTLDVHVASLRKKLGNHDWIETVRGVGLRLGQPS